MEINGRSIPFDAQRQTRVGMLHVTQQKDKNRRLIEVHEMSSTPRARGGLARSSRTLPSRYFNFNFVQRHSPLEMEKRIIFSIEISLANGSSDCPFCFTFYTGKLQSYFSRSSISCYCSSTFLSSVTLLLDNVHQHASLLSVFIPCRTTTADTNFYRAEDRGRCISF